MRYQDRQNTASPSGARQAQTDAGAASVQPLTNTSLSEFQDSQVSQASHRLLSSEGFLSEGIAGLASAALARAKKNLDEKLVEETLKAAAELANEVHAGQLPGYQLFFQLARKLQKFPEAKLHSLRPLSDVFCEQLIARDVQVERFDLTDFEACWIDFTDAWYRVIFPEGCGVLDVAAKAASDEPVEVDVPIKLGDRFGRLISMAYHLSRRNEEFILPQDRLAPILGCNQPNVSRLVAHARRFELLTLVREADRKHSRAAQYRLGPAFANRAKVPSLERRRELLKAQSEALASNAAGAPAARREDEGLAAVSGSPSLLDQMRENVRKREEEM